MRNNNIQNGHLINEATKEFICKLNKDNLEENVKEIAKDMGITYDGLKREVDKRVAKFPSLKNLTQCEEFWEMVAKEIMNKEKPETKYIEDEDDGEFVQSVINRSKKGEKVDDLEIGRAILKAGGIKY